MYGYDRFMKSRSTANFGWQVSPPARGARLCKNVDKPFTRTCSNSMTLLEISGIEVFSEPNLLEPLFSRPDFSELDRA
jgi:hypothetical protein